MLRRKLMMILGSIVLLLLATTVAALWLLQDVLHGQDQLNRHALAMVESVNDVNSKVTLVQVELYQLQLNHKRHLDDLIDLVESIRQAIEALGTHDLLQQMPIAEVYRRVAARQPEFEQHVAALATARDPELAQFHTLATLSLSVAMERDVLELGRTLRERARLEQQQLTSRFRATVLGLTVVFLLVINVSVIVLLRMASIVVQPVERLVDASRHLAQGRFEHRVHLDQHDEFDELARAYNHLAEQLQATEQRRMEMLGHVALALNHELNNASAIIELQLQMVSRRAGGEPGLEKPLRQIHEGLGRMTRTVQALKNVRRIVLTDYVSGVKMLDLARSTEDDAAAPANEPDHTIKPRSNSQETAV